MNTYRFITRTRCGKTDVIVQTGDTLEEARDKYIKHNVLKHSPMIVLKTEVKCNDNWYEV